MNNLPAWVRFLFHRRMLYLFAWLLAIAIAVGRLLNAHTSFDDRRPLTDPNRRVDGNNGHTTIDFGGQWMMGRMLVRGYGRELFSRPRQWEVAQQAFPIANEIPDAAKHDADLLLYYFMGEDDPRWRNFAGSVAGLIAPSDPIQRAAIAIYSEPAWEANRLAELTHPKKNAGIGGPLYPPIHAFLMAPFATGDHPQNAYYAMQVVQTCLCFLGGFGVSRLSGGRFWSPLAAAIILIYPGSRAVIDLGQNSMLSLTILIWGWAFMSRGRLATGGIIWGLLAYKPVWAVSFFLLLLLIRQYRVALAMALTGAGLALATLPFVGIQSWLNWLEVGKEASKIYNIDANWIPLSRDLLGIPRRMFTDFTMPRPNRDTLPLLVGCWVVWTIVVEITLRVYRLRGDGPVPFTGPLPALLILTAWMCTYHFMYYDAMLSAFGIFVLLADPRPFFRPRLVHLVEDSSSDAPTTSKGRSVWLVNSFVLTLVAFLLFEENVTQPMKIEFTAYAHSSTSRLIMHDGSTDIRPRLIAGTGDEYPVETFTIIVLWFWCWITVLMGTKPADTPIVEPSILNGSTSPED
ncbi:MAG: DUF2029 domain-containing protein [Planctomycetes bacterium]|nr:DUF2029 domain-containing protein [Planctomycetota bacterium]